MKKPYEFETVPYIEYGVRCWTEERGWYNAIPWTENVDEAKAVCGVFRGCGMIAKIVKRTIFYENYMWDEYMAWVDERIKEKETLETTVKMVKNLLDSKDGEDDDQV